MDKKFVLKLSVDVQEIDGENLKPYFNGSINYNDLPYGGIVLVESVLVQALQNLVSLGTTVATNPSVAKDLVKMIDIVNK